MAIPQSGPAEAFARLARLNPTQPAPPATRANGGGASSSEQTFVLLKPTAVKRGLVAEICKRFERRGFSVLAMKMLKPGSELAAQHYAPLKGSADYKELVLALASGPAVAMVWRGAGVVSGVCELIGPDDPAAAPPGTIRGDLALEAAADLVEGAHTAAAAASLAALWFTEKELGDAAAAPAAMAAAGTASPAGTAEPAAAAPKRAPAKAKARVAGDRFYITTAINYANGAPHMGHAYEGVCADVIARYHRAYGREVFFLTGADEHGQKIADKADELGLQPIELCDRHVNDFKNLNAKLGVSYDRYIRTTSAEHKAICQALWKKAADRDEIYLHFYKGWYNVREETFVTETEAKESEYKDPVSGKPLQEMEEPSYFFRMGKYHQRLVEHIERHPEFIQPASRRNEIYARLKKEPLRDLSVSRTTFSWGIPVPGDPKHVMYVWFDALSNYLSGIDHPDGANARFWPCDVHLIGKDIIWFHCVIWPTILMACGLPLPTAVLAHGFVHGADGQKMSKSLGNVVDPYEVLKTFSTDAFRYFLIRDSPFGGDVTFSEEALGLRYHAELADTYGNLVNRGLKLCEKYSGAKVPSQAAQPIFSVAELLEQVEAAFAAFALHTAAELVIGALNAANKYVTDTEPWKMPQGDARLVVVRTVLEAVYVCTHLLQPYLIEATPKAFEQLGTPAVLISKLKPALANLTPGTPTVCGEVLFAKVGVGAEAQAGPKVDKAAATKAAQEKAKAEKDAKKAAQAAQQAAKKAEAATATATATSSGGGDGDVSKLELRVGRIVSVAKHPNADALYVEQVDLGEDAPRQVVSGLVKYLSVEQMQDKLVVLVANMKPSKMRQVDSQAMVLCAFAGDGSAAELLEPPGGCAPGDRVEVEGHTGAPEKQLNPKKKQWDLVQPDLKTDAAGLATFRGAPFLTKHGPCRAPSLFECIIK